jgi:hypothetical protein
MIALGGLAYVACCAYETTGVGKIIGSILFCDRSCSRSAPLALFLYTGRIGYAFEKKADYLLALIGRISWKHHRRLRHRLSLLPLRGKIIHLTS